MPEQSNSLYFGDNLEILRNEIRDESVDLIYLDPPFNSKANYNLLLSPRKAKSLAPRITAFEDSWHWGDEAELEFREFSPTVENGCFRDDAGALPLLR